VLLDQVNSNKRLGFATAFAMPTLSEWRPHPQSVGISAKALDEVAKGHTDTDFLLAMSRCVSHRRDRGPNGVLLASVLATSRRKMRKCEYEIRLKTDSPVCTGG